MTLRHTVLAVAVVLAASSCSAATVTPGGASVQTPAAVPVAPITASGVAQVDLTFYGAPDNDPPGSTDIAYPNSRHATAGGVGTYTDPITLATDPRELPAGSIVYIPTLRKYFVMEDDCQDCITEWQTSRHPHLDLWIGAVGGADLLACEEALTPAGLTPIEVNPGQDRPVDPHPLFEAGRCWNPS